MIRYIKLNNFLSFSNIEFNFESNGKPKQLVLIYGENGSGKTNFVKSLLFLRESVNSMGMQKKVAQTINTVLELSNKLTANLDESEKDSLNLFDRVKYVLESNTISDRMKKTCTIDSVDETGIEIGFVTKEGKKGYYIIQYNEEQFTYEKLFYNIKKRSGVVFEIHSAANVKAKDLMNVCQVESRREALLEMVHKYWGKHTLLSIVNNEKEEATQSYVDGTYTKSVLDVIDEIASYNIAASWHVPDDGSAELYPFRDSLSKGIILKSDEKRLDRYENAIRVYLTESYSDITDVHYDRKYKNDSIQYTLFIHKLPGFRY